MSLKRKQVTVSWRKNRQKWQVKYYLEGQRKRPLFAEKQEAKNFARKIALGLAPEDRDSITIDESANRYFDTESQRKNRNSRANDKRYLNLHFHFMNYERGIERLRSVNLFDMEAFRDWLPTLTIEPWSEKPQPMKMGPATVNRCLATLKRFYKKHVQWGNIDESPCLYLEFLDSEANERPAMTGPEYLLALEKATDWFKPVMQMTYLTGLPASCLERLEWADADFSNRRFFVVRKKGRKAKTKRIHMAMTEPVFALLLALRNQWPSVEGPVFRDANGTPLSSDRICKVGNAAIREAGLKHLTMYCMRHGLASDMTTAGVATEIVRQAMGHASIATTQRYANKVHLKSIAGAIESVRGGSLVANSENEPRTKVSGKGV